MPPAECGIEGRAIALGSIAAYYPEANFLVALDHCDAKCGTPSYKSIPVLIHASGKSPCGNR